MPYTDSDKQKAAQHRSYLRDAEKVKERSRNQKRENRAWLKEQKNKPCEDCKLMWPSYVMDFPHRDSSKKINNINRLITSRGRQIVIEEIAKCDLLCSNCHRTRTHEQRISNKRDPLV